MIHKPAAGAARVIYYRDPMHSGYRSAVPGVAPDCGMSLEPVYEGDVAAGGPERIPPGAVIVTPRQRHYAGIRTERAGAGAHERTLRVLGRVAPDESRVYRITAAVDGWVREIAPTTAGEMVKKGQTLGTFYNRDFLTGQQTYLYALATMDRVKESGDAEQMKLTQAQVQAAEENLEFLGMGERQLREIARSRQIARNVALTSPIAGLLLTRAATPGMRFERGAELFRVVELNHVWVFADFFESDARFIQSARDATVVYQGHAYAAHRGSDLPLFDAGSRALKLRLEVDNPGFALRPDMFVDVEMRVVLPPGIHLPSDAVLDSGLRKIVYVEQVDGTFTPREVETGVVSGDRVEIVKGLVAGEQIAVAGNFLLDSESRIRLAASNPGHASGTRSAHDPVCGMDFDGTGSPAFSNYDGKTYLFCSRSCKEKFDRTPGMYLAAAK